jgi:hypothetical protein
MLEEHANDGTNVLFRQIFYTPSLPTLQSAGYPSPRINGWRLGLVAHFGHKSSENLGLNASECTYSRSNELDPETLSG